MVFEDGSEVELDHAILCTGYKVHLPMLPDDIKKQVLDEQTNEITVRFGFRSRSRKFT